MSQANAVNLFPDNLGDMAGRWDEPREKGETKVASEAGSVDLVQGGDEGPGTPPPTDPVPRGNGDTKGQIPPVPDLRLAITLKSGFIKW